MKSDYDLAITPSALSRSISRGTLSLQRALQILAICGVTEIEIKGLKPPVIDGSCAFAMRRLTLIAF
jgi:hypothetical protein